MVYQMTESIRQSQLELFEKNILRMLNQKDTKLANTAAIYNMGIKGLSNLSTIEDTELTDITDKGSNPDKVYEEFKTNNRRSAQKRFTKTFIVDKYDSTVNLICDPTSVLFDILKEAKARMLDRCIAEAAIANVYMGGPGEVPIEKTAAEDGVLEIDASNKKFDYENVISPAITMFENNYVDNKNITLALSSAEKQSLRSDDKYMNAFYSNQNTVDKGDITNASGFNIVSFAGSENGVSEVKNPILKEAEGIRTNLLLAPKSIGFSYEIGTLNAMVSPTKVNSYEITIDLWVKAVRLYGKKVIKVLTTI